MTHRQIDELDAAVFSGDILYTDLNELQEHVSRWQRAIDAHKAMSNTEHYCFKELKDFGDEHGEQLVTPRDDPMEYEYSINFIFESPALATAWLKEQIEDESISLEECEDWEIVKVSEEVIQSATLLL